MSTEFAREGIDPEAFEDLGLDDLDQRADEDAGWTAEDEAHYQAEGQRIAAAHAEDGCETCRIHGFAFCDKE